MLTQLSAARRRRGSRRTSRSIGKARSTCATARCVQLPPHRRCERRGCTNKPQWQYRALQTLSTRLLQPSAGPFPCYVNLVRALRTCSLLREAGYVLSKVLCACSACSSHLLITWPQLCFLHLLGAHSAYCSHICHLVQSTGSSAGVPGHKQVRQGNELAQAPLPCQQPSRQAAAKLWLLIAVPATVLLCSRRHL